MRVVLSGSFRRTKARAAMECGTLKEILPVKAHQEGQHGRN